MAMANDHFQQLMQNKVSRKWFLCGVQSLNKLLPNLAFNLPIGKNIGYMASVAWWTLGHTIFVYCNPEKMRMEREGTRDDNTAPRSLCYHLL